jgi:DNA replication protein DnaC
LSIVWCALNGTPGRRHPPRQSARALGTLETFPFARPPGVNRKQMRGFGELEFIAKAEKIVFCGETGRGKTGLAFGLLLKALENRDRCQFIPAQDPLMKCMLR